MKNVNWFPRKRRPKTHIFLGLLLGFLLSMAVQDKIIKIIIIYGVTILAYFVGEYIYRKKAS